MTPLPTCLGRGPEFRRLLYQLSYSPMRGADGTRTRDRPLTASMGLDSRPVNTQCG